MSPFIAKSAFRQRLCTRSVWIPLAIVAALAAWLLLRPGGGPQLRDSGIHWAETPGVLLVGLDAAGPVGADTPNLDALARDGVRCVLCFAASPSPRTSFASILAGRQPYDLEIPPEDGPLADRIAVLAERFAAAGYAVVGEGPLFRTGDAADDMADVVSRTLAAYRRTAPRPVLLLAHLLAPSAAPDAGGYDTAVGELIAGLKVQGVYRDMMIVVVAGGGAPADADAAARLAPSALRVPLIVKLPGDTGNRGAGRVIADPVSTLDLLPTILRVAGLDAPDDPEGKDISMAMVGRDEVGLRTLYAETGDDVDRFAKSVCEYPWTLTYVRDPAGERYALYRLDVDPNAMRDRSVDRPDIVGELRERLWKRFDPAAPLGAAAPRARLPLIDNAVSSSRVTWTRPSASWSCHG